MNQEPKSLDSDAAKKEALDALQSGAQEVNDYHLHQAETRQSKETASPAVDHEQPEPNVPGIHSPAERKENETIPLSGGLPELQESLRDSDESLAQAEARVDDAYHDKTTFKPDSVVSDLEKIIE